MTNFIDPDDIPFGDQLHAVTDAAFVAVEEPGAGAILGDADNALIPEGGNERVTEP